MHRGKSRIHTGLVGARELVGKRYLADDELRQEYEEEIAPRTQAALKRVLVALGSEIAPPRRVLDLGAGTGAAGRAFRDHFGPQVELVAVDRVAAPGLVVADVTKSVRPRGVEGRFDAIVAAHLLNELGLDIERRSRLVAAWCAELLGPAGLCILIEPALRETSRALLGVRDRLLTAGLSVVAPCRAQQPCPALVNEHDWCHDSAGVIIPGRSAVDFSYLVLRTAAASTADPDWVRVVSDPIKDKGRLRLYACGAAGRGILMRLDRDRSPANAALDEARRGDLLRVAGDDLRVQAHTEVSLRAAAK